MPTTQFSTTKPRPANGLKLMLWPDGPICPHCGLVGAAYKLNGKKHRAGLYKCKGCDRTVHGHGRHRLRALAYSAQQMAAGVAPDVREQEGHHRRTRCTACLGSPTRRRGSCAHRIREAYARRQCPLALAVGGENKVGWRSTRPTSAAKRPTSTQEAHSAPRRSKEAVVAAGRARRPRALASCPECQRRRRLARSWRRR